jgi:hypothetical protein
MGAIQVSNSRGGLVSLCLALASAAEVRRYLRRVGHGEQSLVDGMPVPHHHGNCSPGGYRRLGPLISHLASNVCPTIYIDPPECNRHAPLIKAVYSATHGHILVRGDSGSGTAPECH